MHSLKRSFSLALLAAVLLASAGHAGVADAKFRAAGASGIPNRYIVVLEPDELKAGTDDIAALREVTTVRKELEGIYKIKSGKVWSHAVKGFVIEATEDVARRLARDPKVLSVEQDAAVPIDKAVSSVAPYCATQCLGPTDPLLTTSLPNNTRAFPTSPQSINCSNPDPGSLATCIDNWGLDRSDQTLLPRDGFYNFTHSGSGVHVYVVDIGILSNNREFTGRIGTGVNEITAGGSLEDCSCYHHGAAVASVVGGSTFGIAKGVTLHPVKIIDFCVSPPIGPTVSTYVSAFDWIIQDHTTVSAGPAVVNLSGANWPEYVGTVAFANSVKSVIQHGISFVQSAGNQGDDACTYSVHSPDPTVNVPDAIVAGGYTELHVDGPLRNGRWVADYSDPLYGGTSTTFGECVHRAPGARPDYCGSNYGSCVSLWAPSQYIITAGWDQDPSHTGAYCLFTGTSFAAPHTTGAVALYLQSHPTATPAQVKAALVAGAVPNVLQSSGANSINAGSPNLLLQVVP
ncbi:MAG TPA: S8 family serine peptidase [Thermoanaerobaculia bacterium]|jgi:subtilisin family serine protease|nr:S8 family serine peptidase [Thermoanaerobaculia bacterium]